MNEIHWKSRRYRADQFPAGLATSNQWTKSLWDSTLPVSLFECAYKVNCARNQAAQENQGIYNVPDSLRRIASPK